MKKAVVVNYKGSLLFDVSQNRGEPNSNIHTTTVFYHRLFIEKAFYLLRKTLFLFIILFVCHAVKFAQLILLRF